MKNNCKIMVLKANDPCEKCGLNPCERKCIFAQMYNKSGGVPINKTVERLANRFQFEGVNKMESHSIAQWAIEEILNIGEERNGR